jgi:hypothetical protein
MVLIAEERGSITVSFTVSFFAAGRSFSWSAMTTSSRQISQQVKGSHHVSIFFAQNNLIPSPKDLHFLAFSRNCFGSRAD